MDITERPKEQEKTEIEELRTYFTDTSALFISISIDKDKAPGSSNNHGSILNQNGENLLTFHRNASNEYLIVNPNGRTILTINSEFKVRSGHFNMGLMAETPFGYSVREGNTNRTELVKIKNSTSLLFFHHLTISSCHPFFREFKIIMPEDGLEIGKVGQLKNISDDLKQNVIFELSLPVNMQPQTKALILGASFKIYHDLFRTL